MSLGFRISLARSCPARKALSKVAAVADVAKGAMQARWTVGWFNTLDWHDVACIADT